MKAVAQVADYSASRTPCAAARAEMILRQSPYPALWTVSCQQANGALILSGPVPSFYLKQLAQIMVTKVLNGGQILNQIEVVD
jgi:hypothetical protein